MIYIRGNRIFSKAGEILSHYSIRGNMEVLLKHETFGYINIAGEILRNLNSRGNMEMLLLQETYGDITIAGGNKDITITAEIWIHWCSKENMLTLLLQRNVLKNYNSKRKRRNFYTKGKWRHCYSRVIVDTLL